LSKPFGARVYGSFPKKLPPYWCIFIFIANIFRQVHPLELLVIFASRIYSEFIGFGFGFGFYGLRAIS
jgi:hypothetical protein